MKAKVYTDSIYLASVGQENMTEPIKNLKEIDMNVMAGAHILGDGSLAISFSKSTGPGQQPPLKRHAPA